MHYKIGQLILTPGKKSNSISENFVAQVEKNKEDLAGKLFALIEIESKRSDDLKIINFLLNNINYNYYQNEKLILREKISTLKIEHIFESALARTNKNLIDFIKNEKINFDPYQINATIGIIYKNEIYFTNLGKNKAFLIYKNYDENKFKISDIINNTETKEDKQINIAKLFSNIISGLLPAEGYVLFLNEALPEYISNRQLIEIVTALPPLGAVEQIKNTLSVVNSYVTFLGIIIKRTSINETSYHQKENIIKTSHNSLENLKSTEENTEKLLSPTGIIKFNVKAFFKNKVFLKFFFKNKIKIKNNSLKDIIIKDKIFFNKKPNGWLFLKFWKIIKDIFIFIINIVIYFFNFLKNLKNIKNALLSLIINANNFIKKIKFIFISLTKFQKILIFIVILCLLIFSGNIIRVNIKNKNDINDKIYSENINNIEDKLSKIESSLLYKDNDRARELFFEINNLINTLPRNSKEQKEKYNNLLNSVSRLSDEINNILKISSPKEIINISKFNNQNKINKINLIADKNIIIASDPYLKKIFKVDLKNKIATSTDININTINELSFPSQDKNNNIYYYTSNGNVIRYNSENNKITNLSIKDWGNKEISGMTIFNNKLYFLDNKNNQIYRYNINSADFNKGTSWLRQNYNLTNSIDISIDGKIYILDNDGKILLFSEGENENFTLSQIFPALVKAELFKSSSESQYLYILDRNSKRILVFDKLGSFIIQYYFENLNSIDDFIVDEKNKIIYIIDSQILYSTDLKNK